MAFDFTVRQAGVQGAVDGMTAEHARLTTQLDDAKQSDTALATHWEGDVKVHFLELQTKLAAARADLNTAFNKFISTTSTNLSSTNSTESRLLGQLK